MVCRRLFAPKPHEFRPYLRLRQTSPAHDKPLLSRAWNEVGMKLGWSLPVGDFLSTFFSFFLDTQLTM